MNSLIGYEKYLLHPFLSTLVGIILFLGLFGLGYYVVRIFFKNNLNKYFIFHSPLIGSNLLILFLFPLTSFQLLKDYIFFFVIVTLLIFFLYFIFISKNLYKIVEKDKSLSFIVILYFLLCLAPITHADSLDYHVLSAINILNNGSFSSELLPLHIKAEGAGEILIALGFYLGSEQFGNLIQFGGLLSIIATFKSIKKIENNLFIFSAICTPCFIFFLTSPKPQVMQIANLLFVFSIFYNLKKKQILETKYFLVSSTLLAINFISKFSFLLSSFILFVATFYKSISILNYKKILFISLIIFVIFIIPDFYFINQNFKTSFYDYVQSPMPINLPGYDNMSESIRKISSGNRYLPLWIVIPQTVGSISTVIGPIFLSIFLFKVNKNYLILISILAYFVIVLMFGQATSRFLFPGFLILQFMLMSFEFRNNLCKKIFVNFVKFQYIISVILISFLIYQLTPGSLTYNLRDKVMSKNANGYTLMKWLNSNIDEKEDVILSYHRSLSLINAVSYNAVMLKYIDFTNPKSEIFIQFFKDKKVNKILVLSNEEDTKIYNCRGKLIKQKEKAGKLAGRNPFNIGSFYDAKIYEFDQKKLPECLR